MNLDKLLELAEAATPGPWHFWHGDDDSCMNAYAVTTEACDHEFVSDKGHPWHVVALTLLQQPRLADIGDHSENWVNQRDTSTWRWPENTAYIAAASPEVVAGLSGPRRRRRSGSPPSTRLRPRRRRCSRAATRTRSPTLPAPSAIGSPLRATATPRRSPPSGPHSRR